MSFIGLTPGVGRPTLTSSIGPEVGYVSKPFLAPGGCLHSLVCETFLTLFQPLASVVTCPASVLKTPFASLLRNSCDYIYPIQII